MTVVGFSLCISPITIMMKPIGMKMAARQHSHPKIMPMAIKTRPMTTVLVFTEFPRTISKAMPA
jgi:hypothetical protein